MRLKSKAVLVNASTRGIGLACVKACEKEGAAVYMAARNMERAQEIATPLRPQARAERNRRFAAALNAALWRTGSQ